MKNALHLLLLGAFVAGILALCVWASIDHYQGGDIRRECERAARAGVACVYVPPHYNRSTP